MNKMQLTRSLVMATVLIAGPAVMAQNLPKEATGANPAIFNEPADVTWYLDPVNGNDAGAGTSEQPWKTLKKAFPSAKAQYSAGKKVRMLLKPGMYRESEWLEIAKANSAGYIVIEATESQKAIISGSDDWSRNHGPAPTWTSEGGNIYSKPWNFHWGAGPYWKEEGIGALAVSQVPREEWVVYNDTTVVKQVMKAEDMAASTFRVDETANKLFLWLPGNANPNNTGKVEVAVRRGGWVCRLAYISGVENLKLKGVVFQHSASSIMQTALGLGGDKNVLVEECVFTRNGGSGLALGACQNVTVKNCRMDYNGAMGAAGLNWPPTAINSERNIVFSGCSFNNNNVRGDWANWRGWAVAGSKFCLTSVIKFEDCVFSNNLTGGLWFDISCEDVVVRGCQMKDNHWGDGLFMEISKGPFLVEKCAIGRNGGGANAGGVLVWDSDDVTVRNNTIAGNKARQILTISSDRGAGDNGAVFPAYAHRLRVERNTISGSGMMIDFGGNRLRSTVSESVFANNTYTQHDKADPKAFQIVIPRFHVQLAEIELIGEQMSGGSPVGGTGDTTDDLKGTSTARFGEATRAFDNRLEQRSRWEDLNAPVEGSWIQYAYQTGVSGRLSSYTFVSGNDCPDRDPTDWQLLGSNDGGATWTPVDARTEETFGKRLEKRTFALKDSPTYKAYRFKFTKVRDSSNQGELKKVDFAGWQADGHDTVGSSFNTTPAKQAPHGIRGGSEIRGETRNGQAKENGNMKMGRD